MSIIDHHTIGSTRVFVVDADPETVSIDGFCDDLVLWDREEQDLPSLWYKKLTTGDNTDVIPIFPKIAIDTVDPNTADDLSKGFNYFSRFINSATGHAWICINPAVGAADWKQIT